MEKQKLVVFLRERNLGAGQSDGGIARDPEKGSTDQRCRWSGHAVRRPNPSFTVRSLAHRARWQH